MRAILGTWKRAVLTLFAVLVLGAVAVSIAAETNEGLDAACIARIRRPDTAPAPSEVTVAKAELDRLAGNYMETEMGLLFKIEPVDNRLRLTVLKGPAFPPSTLIPISPTCFRWEGEGLAPGLTGVFQVAGDKTELTVVQPGKPEVVMKRTPGLR
jgi:hypothetical protein